MKFSKFYNKCRGLWWVYRHDANGGCELVKTFKTEAGADNWIKRQVG